MSGGSRNAKQSILAAISNLQRITAKLEAETAALVTLKAELETLQAASKQFNSLNKKRELLQHSLEMLEAQAAKSQFGALQIKAAELEEVQACCIVFCPSAVQSMLACRFKLVSLIAVSCDDLAICSLQRPLELPKSTLARPQRRWKLV